ncbi:Guanine nucleotide exchange factor for Cdc42p [Recurvomyces mirabilis]|uniref:Guanine nucleotide exchange factor for Cdc42p n=1 Tax=Recurvomyces mirabilis TaxID=574656 RepID=A0AAE1C2W6_9PEZI|nr:Guanine nucleotide exchange factor for Cdc42p [Recurvomyces mirabilis]
MEAVAVFNPTVHLARSYTAPANKKNSSTATAARRPSGPSSTTSARFPNNNNMTAHTTNHPSLLHSQGHTSSNYSIQSQPSSRSSDGTQGTSHSTLFAPPPLPPGAAALANGEVTATDNVMNSVADASSSLFQICVSLRQRLIGVPGFREWLIGEEEEADDDTDPVTLLWRTFRRGLPLMMLYNALNPSQPLELKVGVKEEKSGKAATYKFLQACVNDLKFPQDQCFIITDLYGDDTTGFVKVARVVNRVLDILVQRGLVDDVRPTANDFEQAEKGLKRSQRQHIVHELVSTERTYVQHLELLQAFKHLVEEKGIIPGDAIHDIFLNLNSLLDFQRRFLIRVEQTNAQPEEEQNWGKLFIMYCEAFKVYEPYIANQRKCEKTVVAEFSKLKDAGGSDQMRQMVESSPTLYGFLMKPFQRLSKYPLLLKDLYKKGDLDDAKKLDLLMGEEAATSILTRTNEAIDREEKAAAVQELKVRVEDWKGHRVEGFGQLLLYGTFTVLKSENLASGKDGERQYHVYLFETILLCCKDIDPTKPKNKMLNKQLVDRQSGKPKLQLKGRIFMQNVTEVVKISKQGMSPSNSRDDDIIGHFCIVRGSESIFWKGDPSIENFIVRFTTQEMLRRWGEQIDAQRVQYRSKTGRDSDGSRSGGGGGGGGGSGGGSGGGTSATQFAFMQNQPLLENPYAKMAQEEDEEDQEDDGLETLVGSGSSSVQYGNGNGGYPYPGREFEDSRNASSSSLRSRSTTGDSGAGPTPNLGRAHPPRFAQGSLSQQQASLSLRTQQLSNAAMSPSGRMPEQDSYFSPTGDSPQNSIRTSSSSGMYPFPRQLSGGGAPPTSQPMMPNGAGAYWDEQQGAYSSHGQTYSQDYHRQPPHGGQSRFTAPAIGRQREPSVTTANGYGPHTGRPTGPGSRMHSAQQMPTQQHRNRSASSPDIHQGGPRGGVPGTALRNGAGQQQPPVPDMPTNYQYPGGRASPASAVIGMAGTMPSRQSPQLLRERSYQVGRLGSQQNHGQGQPSIDQSFSRTGTPVSMSNRSGTPVTTTGAAAAAAAGAPPLPPPPTTAIPNPPPPQPQSSNLDLPAPTQLKVKVHCPSASQTLTLVVPLNISYQSLKDRIDAKLQRSTNLSLGTSGGGGGGGREGQQVVKLKYLDEEDFVSILSDEDVLTAFETWREQRGGGVEGSGTGPGGMGEIELFCQR